MTLREIGIFQQLISALSSGGAAVEDGSRDVIEGGPKKDH